MAKFRKKAVVIEAIRWNGATIGLTNGGEPFKTERLELPDWMPTCKQQLETEGLTMAAVKPGEVWRHDDILYIGTLEGTHAAMSGDWIIRGIKGELYPCKPDIFEATYDAVGEDPQQQPDPEPDDPGALDVPEPQPLDVADIDTASFATRIAQVAAADLYGLLAYGVVNPIDAWFNPDAEGGAIEADIEKLGSYVCEHLVDQGERLFRWATSEKIAAGRWEGLAFADRLAFETFTETCRRTFLAMRVSQQAIEDARRQSDAIKPKPPRLEDTIFESNGGLLELDEAHMQTYGLRARYERERAAEAEHLAQAAKFNGADPAAFDHDGDGAPGGSKPAPDKTKKTTMKPMSVGEAPPRPPVNRGGRGKKKAE